MALRTCPTSGRRAVDTKGGSQVVILGWLIAFFTGGLLDDKKKRQARRKSK